MLARSRAPPHMTSLAQAQAAMQASAGRAITPAALPAPVLGWNARDSLDGMAPGYAVQLDNFFPYNGFVAVRGGSTLYVGGLGGPVKTLAYWNDAATEKVIAGANGQLWDVSQGSAVSLASGFTNDEWQWVQNKGTRTATAATAVLYLLNGVDTAQFYNGTAVAPVAWTAAAGGPTLNLAALHNATISKDVLYVAEKGQLGFWHSAKGAVAPTVELTWFDLGTILPNGGEIVAIATYTVEGGQGPDDYTCFVASTGWIAVYRGGDPSQATDWGIIGRYPLGTTLGKRCVLEVAGDVIVMTVNGYISMRQFIQIGGLLRQSFVFNDNIQPEVVRQTLATKGLFGWQPVLVPGQTLAVFNVPLSGTTFEQHIVNTQTEAWARIKGWNALCWLATTDRLLYGSTDGKVIAANESTLEESGGLIVADGITAFSEFGLRGVRKHFQMYKPVLEISGAATVRMAMAVDYDLNAPLTETAAAPLETSAVWNVGEWNRGKWGGAPRTVNNWLSAGQLGYSAAVRLNVNSSAQFCRWKSTDISFVSGGIL